MKGIDLIWNYLILKRKKVLIGKHCNFKGQLFVHGKKAAIEIGDNVTIYSKSSINPTSGFHHTHLRTEENGNIVIGNNVGISHANITAYESVIIEDNVLIGSGVKIWDTDFHSIKYSERIVEDSCAKTSGIIIKEGAFIGACSIILKGVTIGKRSVVGAGSVVTKNIPDNQVWGGNPARYIKDVSTECTNKIY